MLRRHAVLMGIFACVATVALLASVKADSAAADHVAECDPGIEPALEFEPVPAELAWGRRLDLSYYYSDNLDSPNTTSSSLVHFAFEAANPADPISHSFETDSEEVSVRFDRGDGQGRVTWSWHEWDADMPSPPECARSFGDLINPVRGRFRVPTRGSRLAPSISA